MVVNGRLVSNISEMNNKEFKAKRGVARLRKT